MPHEYPALPEEEQFSGDVSHWSKSYTHQTCDGISSVTRVGEDFVRTMLADPYFYANRSYCSGCGSVVQKKVLVWSGDEQSFYAKVRQLRTEIPLFDRRCFRAVRVCFLLGLLAAIPFGLLGLLIGWFVSASLMGLCAGAGLGFPPGFVYCVRLRFF